MLKRFVFVTAVLVGGGLTVPAVAGAQSKSQPRPRPATVVRPGGTRAGMAPAPRESSERTHFRTPETRGGFGEGVGVVVGSYGHLPRRRARHDYCGDRDSAARSAVSTAPAAYPIQPQPTQPVVAQPPYGGMVPNSHSPGC